MEPTLRPGRPVMDIQPQRPAPQSLPRADFAVAGAAPAGPAPVMPAPAPILTQPPEEHHEVQPTPEHFPAKLPRSKAPVGIILTAILVGACLIGVAVFGYLKTRDDTPVNKTDTTTQAVDSDDVDDSLTEADDTLGDLDEAADFNDAALSDEILGL